MRTVILALAVLLLGGVAFAQHPEMGFKETQLTGAWDSMYVLNAFGGLKVEVWNWSTTDTVKFFFGKTKADSATAVVYSLYPTSGFLNEIPVAGGNYKALFRRAINGSARSVVNRMIYNEK